MGKDLQEYYDTKEDLALKFAKQLNVVPESYHGNDFVGDKCMFLLNSLDKLLEYLPTALHGYVDVFNALRDINQKLMTVAGPPENYVEIIDQFSDAAKRNKIKLTPSIHAILSHIKDFYKLAGTEFGLGLYSEQAGEHVHHDFEDRVWESAYKRHVEHKQYGPQLKQAVSKYNSEHL